MKKGNFLMPAVTSQEFKDMDQLVFCRKEVPVIKKTVKYKGEDCDVYEGTCLIADNVSMKFYVKEDDFETNNGNTIAYKVTFCGFKYDPDKQSTGRRKTNKSGRR